MPQRPVPFLLAVDGGSLLRIHVQPRASRTEVAGRHGDALKVRLKSPPVDGAANEELLRFLAGMLEVPRATLSLVRGGSSRAKTIQVTGLDPAAVLGRLEGGGGPR